MKIVHPDKWLPCDGISLEEAADTAVRCSDRHVLVVAGPGAGKTELLAQKAAFLFQTNQCREPQKILAISFKTDAAQNLKERVEKRCGTDIKGRFVSMTYDAFAKNIMVWAGAVKTIFNDFYRELNPKCIRLIMNHRSAPRLVALQKAMYESLKEKATEVCASGNWAEDDGNIALFIADNEQLEAAAVSKDILLKISNGVEPHDICILCKQKPQDYASAVIEELEKHGVRARIETGYQDLIKEPIVDLFIKFMICADSRKHPNEWTFIEELLVELWGISGMRENDTFDEMQRKLSAVVNVVKKNIQQKLDTEQWHSTLNSIIDFFGIGNIKAKFPAYKQGTYFMNVINQFESLFFEEYVAAHGVWNLAIENFRGDHSVPIMTIHKSKGLEYNAVYFIGLEDSAFWNFRNQPDEDRCTFFVALSRAKASVTFTFCKKRSGMKCPMQRHNAINEFFDLLQRPGIAEVKRFQNR